MRLAVPLSVNAYGVSPGRVAVPDALTLRTVPVRVPVALPLSVMPPAQVASNVPVYVSPLC